MNRIVLMGNLTANPVLTYKTDEEGQSTAIANFTLAVTNTSRGYNGDDTDFFRCVSFGKQAEFIEKYFKKGMRAAVDGHIHSNNYTNKNGEKVYGFNIILDQIDFGEKKVVANGASKEDEPPFR